MKTRLSYSLLNSIIECPHVYLNHLAGLPKFSIPAFAEGKAIHRIVQDSVCGKIPHELLKDIPLFEIVEEKDRDPRTKFEVDINDKYYLIGYMDGTNKARDAILEIKSSSTPWSISKFANLAQWKIYAKYLPTAKKVWLVNTPRSVNLWNKSNIKVFSTTITPQHYQQAEDFIDKGVYIIEHIKEAVDNEPKLERRHPACFYKGCSWCPE